MQKGEIFPLRFIHRGMPVLLSPLFPLRLQIIPSTSPLTRNLFLVCSIFTLLIFKSCGDGDLVLIAKYAPTLEGSPFIAHVSSDPNRLLVSGQSLASSPVGKPAYFTISNVTGTVEDVEVNVEGK